MDKKKGIEQGQNMYVEISAVCHNSQDCIQTLVNIEKKKIQRSESEMQDKLSSKYKN